MHIKNFSEFNEGARWNNDKSGVILSFDNRENDLMITNISKVKSKEGGFGKYLFNVYFGLEASQDISDIKKDLALEKKYADLMQRLKQGYFNMAKVGEPDYKLTINDIHKGIFPELSDYDEKLFYQFMKDTGKIDPNLKYVVMAESNDIMSELMANVISKYTGAEIIKLQKEKYNDLKILKFYRKIPQLDTTNINKSSLSNFQLSILNDYLDFMDKNEAGRKSIEGGIINSEEILKLMNMNISGAPFLDTLIKSRNITRKVNKNGDTSSGTVISGNRLFNNVRHYLSTKYNFDENFINKVKECIEYGSTSKMLIIDDNIQHGSDFREIIKMCGYVADVLQITKKSTLASFAKTTAIQNKIRSTSNKIEKEKLEKLLKDTEVSSKTTISNITGYVLYERPVIASSDLLDER